MGALSDLWLTGRSLLAVCIFSTVLLSCKSESPKWYTYFREIGTYSSPRLTDLNGDGIPDIVMGAGGREDHRSDSAVIAVDGATGTLLWAFPGLNQYVGSAIFQDVDGDGVDDVFIGGRWAQFSAISGRDGKLIWTFHPKRSSPSGSDSGWYVFTTPQFVPDQDGDGFRDILVSNGGNALAAPEEENRPAGRLLVLSSTSGKILANMTVPDGREIYMSVITAESGRADDPLVYFGTGGETIGGSFYRISLSSIMANDTAGAVLLARSEKKGFIASPVLADLNSDGRDDIVINQVNGTMLAIDGASDSLLWKIELPGTEAYTVPAVGDFNGDSVPDLFCNFAIGTFPKLERSVRFMVNGKDGSIEYRDTIQAFQYASAVAADLNADGICEVVINQSAVERRRFEDYYYSVLQVFDFRNSKVYAIGDTLPATNFASTPWIGDIDDDNELDVIYCAVKYNDVRFDLQRPQGVLIGHFRTGIPIRKPIRWGAYMGSRYDGRFVQ